MATRATGNRQPFLSHPVRMVTGMVDMPLEEDRMLIDCDECSMQHTDACEDCVVSLLLNEMLGPIEVDREQAAALDVLADAGLVPTLRLVPRVQTPDTPRSQAG